MASSSSSSSRRKPTNPGPITINVVDGTPSGHYYHGFITRISSHVTHVDEFPPTQTWSQHKKAGRVEALYRDLTDAYSLPSWNDGSEMAQKFRTWFNDSARHKWNDHKNRSLRRTYDLCKGDVTQASGHQPSTVDTDTWNSLLSTYSQNHIVDESGFSKSAKCKASRSCNELDHRLGRESLGSWKGKFRRSRGRDPQAVEIFSKEFTKQDPLLASPGNLPPPHMRGKPVSERNIEIGVFEPFGTVELVQLPLDETGHCKGFGFVQFARLEDARNAQNLNGQLEIAGRTIKVSAVSDQAGMQDVGANAGDFDDDEGGGMSLNAHSRALLMQKLDQRGSATSVGGSLVNAAASIPALAIPSASVLGAPPVVTHLMQSTVPALAGLQVPAMSIASITAAVETVGVPSECLLLKNMFDPAVETEPDFDLDIKDDVQDECQKFGKVKHIFVDKNSAGHVYLCFESVNAAMDAQRALHGRWFAGKMITTTFMLPQSYEAKFSML